MAEDMERAPQQFPLDTAKHCFHASFDGKSELDVALESLWLDRRSLNLFRYELGNLHTKFLPGRFEFLTQLNIKRATHRREPQFVSDIVMPFNAEEFNFCKVPEREKLLLLSGLYYDVMADTKAEHLIVINDSPLEHCHSLLVPMVDSCLPQVLTFEGIGAAIEIALFSHSSQLRLMYNSLGGYASVNHMHFHIIYLEHRLFLETAHVSHLKGRLYETIDYPADGFVFEILQEKDVVEVISSVSMVAEFFIEKKIAHNIFITRGVPFSDYPMEPKVYGDYKSLRIYMWPREAVFGVKNDLGFNVAACELAGHIPIKDKNLFEVINEDQISQRLQDTCFDTFMQVRVDVADLFK